jgi:aminopeptidase-like protein
MPVGEAVLEGDSPHSILIIAHICHPGIADDGLSGAVTGIRLMRWLSALPRRRYTYRLLLPVETIGSIAWLWKRRDLLPHLAAGMVYSYIFSGTSLSVAHAI